jgi:hypothetical protein
VALKHAMEVDPKLERTIGVVSKLDRINGEDKVSSIVDVLKNKVVPLAKGYIGVINANPNQVPLIRINYYITHKMAFLLLNFKGKEQFSNGRGS